VTVEVSVRVCPAVTVADVGDTLSVVMPGGGVCTVIVAEPTMPSTVALIVTVPADTPVTTPVEFTVATLALSVAQLTVRPVSACPAESRTVTVNCCVEPVSTLAFAGATLTVATGTSVTLTVTVAVRDAAEKPVFPADDAVTVMVAVPGPTAMMSPADETVATAGAVVPKVTVAAGAPLGCVTTGESAELLPTARLTDVGVTDTAVIDVGSARTVMVMVPVTPPAVAVIVAVPTATAVTRPVAVTVAMAEFEVVHVIARPVRSAPLESRTVVVSCCVLPGIIDTEPGVTCTLATAGATVTVTSSVSVAAAYVVLPAAVAVTVMIAVPVDSAVITPALVTVATLGSALP
jgi:hypothetical protein